MLTTNYFPRRLPLPRDSPLRSVNLARRRLVAIAILASRVALVRSMIRSIIDFQIQIGSGFRELGKWKTDVTGIGGELFIRAAELPHKNGALFGRS